MKSYRDDFLHEISDVQRCRDKLSKEAMSQARDLQRNTLAAGIIVAKQDIQPKLPEANLEACIILIVQKTWIRPTSVRLKVEMRQGCIRKGHDNICSPTRVILIDILRSFLLLPSLMVEQMIS